MSKHRLWGVIAAAATLVTGLTISAGTATAASGWTIQNTPSPAGVQLNAVACPAANACVAVGPSQAEAWNGTTWTLVPSPAGVFNSVACTSVDACTAVGYSGAPSSISTLVEVWNGTSWSIQSSPNPGGPGDIAELTGVSCTSASNCVAVGSYHPVIGPATDALAEVWDGSSWKIKQAVTPSGATYVALSGVSCTSTSNCIAVGNSDGSTLAESWDGKSWSLQSTASTPGIGSEGILSSVDCTSANNCMAVGDVSGFGLTLAETWNGTSWAISPTPNPVVATNPPGGTTSTLNSVSCASATSCTAVGSYTSNGGNPGVSSNSALTLIEAWNGAAWTIQPSPNPASAEASFLQGVSCTSPSACTAVGVYYPPGSGGPALGGPNALVESES